MRNVLGFVVKAAVSAALLYFAFTRVNLDVLEQRLNRIDYVWLVVAILLLVLQIIFGALRWQVIVGRCGIPFGTKLALRYNFIAAFFNQTLPSTVGGDAVRIWMVGRHDGSWGAATYSVLIDRLTGVMVLALLVIVCLPWSFALIGDINGRIALLVVGFGSITACLLFITFTFVSPELRERWWVTRQLGAAAAIARNLFGSPDGAVVFGYSLIIHALSVSAAWVVAKSVAAPLEWSQALVLILPVLLIATIPVSIAGWGTRETAMVLAFTYAGLAAADGLAVSVLLGASSFVAGLIGGVIWIFNRGKGRPGTAQPAR
jgi:glycosyltransferase 2 family protein